MKLWWHQKSHKKKSRKSVFGGEVRSQKEIKKLGDKIKAHENRIELEAQSAGIFKPYKTQTRKTPLTHWFYPEGTLILEAPAAQEDVSAQLTALSLAKGFTEIETRLDGFEPAFKKPNTLYVIDETMAVASGIEPGIQKAIGTVDISETLLGPDGPYDVPKKIDVLARIPGSVE